MGKFFRIMLAILSLLIFSFNISPILSSLGKLNAGSIVGTGVSFALMLYVIYFDLINKIVLKIWKKRFGKAFLSVFFTFVLICAGVGGFTFYKVAFPDNISDKNTEYIFVLGCQVNGSKPGTFLKKRIDKAFEYMCKYPNSKAILTGGKGKDEDISEALCMYNELTKMGIDEKRLIIEDKSINTRENIKFSYELIKSEDPYEVTIISNDFHIYRASQFAKKLGLKPYAYPCKTSVFYFVPLAIREVAAVVVQVYL